MFTAAPCPQIDDFKRILFSKKNNLQPWRQSSKNDVFLFSRSSWALWTIIKFYLKKNNKETLNLFLPSYICNDFLTYLDDFNISFVFYPVTSSLKPNWEKINQSEITPDLFLLVHYFGVESDISQTRKYCKKNNCLFVEDASHVLKPYGKIGKASDFIFYSPYKFLPIPNGSILTCRLPGNEHILFSSIISQTFSSQSYSWKWLLKKVIQKMIPHDLFYKFRIGEFVFDVDPVALSTKKQISISDYAYRFLNTITIDKLDRINKKRWKNYTALCDIFTKEKIDLPFEACPYLFSLSFENTDIAKSRYKKLGYEGFLPSTWPDLPLQVKQNNDQANTLRNNHCFLLIHQDFNVDFYLKKTESKGVTIDWATSNKDEWDQIYNKIQNSNLLQSWEYADAKSTNLKYVAVRGLVKKNNKIIGLVQGLNMKLPLGLKIRRINRGPLFIESQSTLLDRIQTLRLCRSIYPLTLIAPEFSGINANAYARFSGLKKRSSQKHSSIWIDLNKSLEVIRCELDSKWRNTLKASEKNDLEILIVSEKLDFDKLLSTYQNQQKINQFIGISSQIVESLYESNKLIQFDAIRDGGVISSVVIAKHGLSCTYLIGVNTDDGKYYKANYLLLWKSIEYMKEQGYRSFDLGGIDEINTPQITKFKKGICKNVYILSGEYFL